MTAKKTSRRVLSIIMAITLMLTTLVCFDIGSLMGSAADLSDTITVSDNEMADVYFFVPEQIYLQPTLTSNSAQGKYNFQWFVDSEFDESTKSQTLRTGENSTGNFYFYYENASQVTISYKYLNKDLTEMTAYMDTSKATTTSDYANSSCNIKLASYSNALRASNTHASSTYIYYTVAGNKINTTLTREGVSPYLLAGSDGYYIQWTASYVDKLDGQTKVAYAYTYVYKPFIAPVGSGQRTRNGTGSSHKASNLSWVSGVHGLVTTGEKTPNSGLNNNGLMAFSSTEPTGVSLGVVGPQRYAQFATEVESNGYFKYTAGNNSAQNWLGGSGGYINVASFNYYAIDEGKSLNATDHMVNNFCAAPTSKLTVDVSRYTSFAQIPNLTVGLMVTSDEDSDSNKGAWYIADCSDRVEDNKYYGYSTSKTAMTNMYNNYSTVIASQGSLSSLGAYEKEGVKYNGPITLNFYDTSSCVRTYKIRTGYVNYQGGDYAANSAAMPIEVTQTNKDTLRMAYNNATNLVAKYGLKADGTSVYFDSANENWTTFVKLYKLAGSMLADMELSSTETVSGYTLSTVVSGLNSAAEALNDAKLTSTASARFLALSQTSGGYKLVEVKDVATRAAATDVAKSFTYGQSISFKAASFSGYTFVGVAEGLLEADSTVGIDYSSLLATTDSQINVNYANASSKVQYTFLYAQEAFSTIVDTRGGDFNYLHVITEDFPSIGGMGYPTYAADTTVETDLNYSVLGNDITVWTTEQTTLPKYQFLPYVAQLEAGTEYIVSYKVTGTDFANVALSIYSPSFTGGNGETSSFYSISGNGASVKMGAVDAGDAYIRVELMNDARNGQKVMISDLCITKADKNELYLQASTQYPMNFVSSSTDKTGMSYTANSNTGFTVTSQYNSSTYEQKQLLPLYVELKPNSTYVITYNISGLDDSKVTFDFVNSSFTGGNGNTITAYRFTESGGKITVSSADDGIAQLRVNYASGIAANTKTTVTNLTITNLDSKTTLNGMFNDTKTLGIPVKEGYKFNGWTVKSNDLSANPYGSVTETVEGSVYEYRFGAGTDIVEAQWATDTCTVIFRNYDGTIVDEQSVAYGSAAKTPTTIPERGGYSFVGWDTDYSKVTSDLIIEPIYEELNISITLDKTTVTLYEGAFETVTATIDPVVSGISDIVWVSSNDKVATVTKGANNVGVIQGIATGSAVITASVTYNGNTYTGSCTVIVQTNKPTAMTVVSAPTKTQYIVGEELDLTGLAVTITYNNGTTTDPVEYDFTELPGVMTISNVNMNSAGTRTVRLSYKENNTTVTATTKITVAALTPTKIEFINNPTKEYFVGDLASAFDPSGMKVKVTYNNGSSNTLDVDDLDIEYSGFNSSVAGTVTMTGTYEELDANFTITVNAVELVSVAIKTLPNKTQYLVGDELDATGLSLTASYNNGTSKTVSTDITCTGFSSTTDGVKTVTATYGGKSTTFEVTVNPIELVSIAVKTNPTKVEYVVGESFDQTGLVITATYNNGSTADITEDIVCTGFDSTASGIKTITATYGGKTATFEVNVNEPTPTGISVSKLPDKTSYFVGDTFDATGLVINVTYNNGTNADIAAGFSCECGDLSEAGTKTVTVSYGDFTDTFDITVKAIEVVGIDITTEPTKTTFYTGDELDTTGLVLTLEYNNGDTATVTDGFTVEGYDKNTAGEQTITVKYGDFSDTYSVTVLQSYANYDEVDEAIAAANAKIAEGIYTDDSVAALNDAINAVVRGLMADQQSTVDGYALDIAEKTEALEEKSADYDALDAAILAKNTEIAKNLYTEDSVAEFNALVATFDRTLGISKQSTVDGYTAKVEAFVLTYKSADYTELDALVDEVNALDSSLYENYDEIYANYFFDYIFSVIPSHRDYNITEQDKVDEMTATLQSYVDMLQLKETKVAKFELKNGAAFKSGKYIVGLTTRLTDATLKSGYFVMENVTVTVTKAAKGGRYIGTGSVVTVTNDLTGEKMAEYIIVIYGDVSGDGVINATDATKISNIVSGEKVTAEQRMAANLNGDRSVNAVDYNILNNVLKGSAKIDQTTGKAK